MPNKDLIYKSNSLIEASYRLSVMEQRLVLACIKQIRHDEEITDEIMYSISVQDIVALSEIDAKTTYHELKEAALRLKRREVSIEREPNGGSKKKKPLVCGWVQTISYAEDEGRVELRFNKDMLPYLNQFTQQFTKYHLKAVAKMNSAHAIRLYEILVQWREKGKLEIELEWLRKTLQLEDKYPAIKDLKKYVIDIAVNQINEHSDIKVKWTQRKTGRRVTHLIFTFGEKAAPAPAKPKAKSTGPKINGIAKADIEKHARPGETYEQAAARLVKSRNATRK